MEENNKLTQDSSNRAVSATTEVNQDNQPTSQEIVDEPLAQQVMDSIPQTRAKSKKGIVIGIIALLCVISAVCTVICNSPKNIIKKSVVNTVQVLNERNGVYSKLKDCFTEDFFISQPYEQNFNLQLNNISNTDRFNNIGISINSQTNITDKKAAADFGITYQGMQLINANMFVNENEWFVKLPTLYNAWFKGNNKNVMEQYANSAFNSNGYFEYDPEKEISIDPFSSNNSLNNLLSDYISDTTELFNNITYDKLDEEKSIDNKTYKGYSVTISGDNVKAYINNITTALSSEENASVVTALKQTYGIDLEEFKAELEKLTFSDTTFKIYTDKKLICSVEFDIAYKYEDIESKINVKLNYSGDCFEMIFDNYNNTVITLKDTISIEENGVSQTDLISVNDKNTVTEFSITTNLTNDNAISLNGNANINGKNAMSFNADGLAVLAENSIKLNFDNIEITADTDTANMSGTYYVGMLTDEISKPDGEIIPIFEESKKKIEEISSEIQSKLYSLMYAIS